MDIYGRNPVLEYLRTLRPGNVASLFVLKNAHGKIIHAIVSEAERIGIKPQWVDKSFFENRIPSSVHQGVLLQLSGYHQMPATADSVVKTALDTKGVVVFLDSLMDPHNVGAIIRTAEALGAVGVVISSARSSPINSSVVKASAGATAYLPVVEISNVGSFIAKAKTEGLWIIGTSSNGDHRLDDLKRCRPSVLIIGSEGVGIRQSVVKKCDMVVGIPLKGKIGSLNASVAAGILLYQLLKE
ncbi:MAG: 23S rRNA (guanosine(2251)-2'-O)-methyltransferase RlmB [Spirochaetes bacterium]|nr:23S rRNA (guanosine(2251)-2'-O)-methyltransferase RlmB [Spirochaetota bacterium]